MPRRRGLRKCIVRDDESYYYTRDMPNDDTLRRVI